MLRNNRNFDVVSFQRGKRIFQADTELAYNDIASTQLLLVFLLGEMFVLQAATEITDVPS